MQIIFTVIACSAFCAALKSSHEKGQESNGDLVLKFSSSMVNMLLTSNVFAVAILLTITVLSFKNGDINKTFPIFVMFFSFFIVLLAFYIYTKRKKIIVNGENIKVYNMFGGIDNYTFEEIIKIKDNPRNNIILYTKNKKKFSVDYQMNNFLNFRKLLVSKNIEKNS